MLPPRSGSSESSSSNNTSDWRLRATWRRKVHAKSSAVNGGYGFISALDCESAGRGGFLESDERLSHSAVKQQARTVRK